MHVRFGVVGYIGVFVSYFVCVSREEAIWLNWFRVTSFQVVSSPPLVESCRIVGRLVSKVTLFKPTSSFSSYGTILLFSLVI